MTHTCQRDDARPSPTIRASRLLETGAFAREALRRWNSIGAIAPSGKALARELIRPVASSTLAAPSVLEVGAGTGSVTRELLAALPSAGRLDIVESNERFAKRLRRLASVLSAERSAVHAVRIQEFHPDKRYDAVVSGLPLTNFDPVEVQEIMAHTLELLRPGGSLTYFVYLGTRRMRQLSSSRTESRRHAAVDTVMADFQTRYAVSNSIVWSNVPPARVWHLRRA